MDSKSVTLGLSRLPDPLYSVSYSLVLYCFTRPDASSVNSTSVLLRQIVWSSPTRVEAPTVYCITLCSQCVPLFLHHYSLPLYISLLLSAPLPTTITAHAVCIRRDRILDISSLRRHLRLVFLGQDLNQLLIPRWQTLPDGPVLNVQGNNPTDFAVAAQAFLAGKVSSAPSDWQVNNPLAFRTASSDLYTIVYFNQMLVSFLLFYNWHVHRRVDLVLPVQPPCRECSWSSRHPDKQSQSCCLVRLSPLRQHYRKDGFHQR